MNTPLRFRTVTAGSQIMLPIYPLFLLYVGWNYANGDPRRTIGPSFDFARELWPMHRWGYLFIAIGVTVLVGYVIAYMGRGRIVAVVGLLLGAALCLWWAFAFYGSAANAHPATGPLPSLNGWAVWTFIAAAFTASAFSLTLDRPSHAG